MALLVLKELQVSHVYTTQHRSIFERRDDDGKYWLEDSCLFCLGVMLFLLAFSTTFCFDKLHALKQVWNKYLHQHLFQKNFIHTSQELRVDKLLSKGMIATVRRKCILQSIIRKRECFYVIVQKTNVCALVSRLQPNCCVHPFVAETGIWCLAADATMIYQNTELRPWWTKPKLLKVSHLKISESRTCLPVIIFQFDFNKMFTWVFDILICMYIYIPYCAWFS